MRSEENFDLKFSKSSSILEVRSTDSFASSSFLSQIPSSLSKSSLSFSAYKVKHLEYSDSL